MKRGVDRILTTQTGSLVRPPELLAFVKARQAGQGIDQRAYEATLKDSVRDVVARQVEAGIDIPNDGEFGKSHELVAVRAAEPLEPVRARGGSASLRGLLRGARTRCRRPS